MSKPLKNAVIQRDDRLMEQTIQTRFVGQDRVSLCWPKPKYDRAMPGGLRVRFENVSFEAHPNYVYVTIPDAAVEFFRRVRTVEFDLAGKTPQALCEMAKEIVEGRIKKWRAARTKSEKHLVWLEGGMSWLPSPVAPKAKQLESVLFGLKRRQARQRQVLRELRRLEWENSEEGRRAKMDRGIERRKKRNQKLIGPKRTGPKRGGARAKKN